jgi:hypothetical protein
LPHKSFPSCLLLVKTSSETVVWGERRFSTDLLVVVVDLLDTADLLVDTVDLVLAVVFLSGLDPVSILRVSCTFLTFSNF